MIEELMEENNKLRRCLLAIERAHRGKKQHNPPSVNEILEEMLKACKINTIEFANALGVSRNTVSKILNGHSSITPDVALKIGKVLSMDAKFLLDMQTVHELWVAKQNIDLSDVVVLREDGECI